MSREYVYDKCGEHMNHVGMLSHTCSQSKVVARAFMRVGELLASNNTTNVQWAMKRVAEEFDKHD